MNPVGGPEAIAGMGRAVGIGQAPGAGSFGRMRSLREMEPQRGITLQPSEVAQPSFADTLSEALGEVNDLQLRADNMIERFSAGQVKDLHEVIIAQQEAAIAFRLVQSVRDKLIQGYQEIMRMQV